MLSLRKNIIPALIILGLFLTGTSVTAQVSEQDIAKISKALPAKTPAAVVQPRKLLVFNLSKQLLLLKPQFSV